MQKACWGVLQLQRAKLGAWCKGRPRRGRGSQSESLSESAAVSCGAVAKGSELAVMAKQGERTG